MKFRWAASADKTTQAQTARRLRLGRGRHRAAHRRQGQAADVLEREVLEVHPGSGARPVAAKADAGWFEKTFDTRIDKAAKPLKSGDLEPDLEITAHKGGMPKVEKSGKSAADNAQALADAMGVEPEQMDHLVDMMGKKLSKNFGKAWAEAVKNAPVAKEA